MAGHLPAHWRWWMNSFFFLTSMHAFSLPVRLSHFNPQHINLLVPAGANCGVLECCSFLINHARGSLGPLHSFNSVCSIWFFCIEAKGRGGREWKEEEESKEGNLDADRIHSYSESAPGNRCQEMFIAISQEFLKILSWVVFGGERQIDTWLVGWIFSRSIGFVCCLIWLLFTWYLCKLQDWILTLSFFLALCK